MGQSKYPYNRSVDSGSARRVRYIFFQQTVPLFNLADLLSVYKGMERAPRRISMCLAVIALLKLQTSDWPIALGRRGSSGGWRMMSVRSRALSAVREINDICLIIG